MLIDVMKHSNSAVDTLLSVNSKMSVNINEAFSNPLNCIFRD